jgi:peptide chain release factor 1
MSLFTKLTSIKQRYKELESLLSDSSVFGDRKKMREVNEEFAQVSAIMEMIQRCEKTQADLQSAEQTLKEADDEEMKQLAQAEIESLQVQIPQLEKELMVALVSPDPMDKKNIIVEMRAGAGGDESALFTTELMRAYTMYGEHQGWKTELVSANRNDLGGFKEVIFSISGRNVYSRLKYESGVHRVQRVPETEKQGRVHTSTVTVAILPEAEEVDVHIEPKDLIIESTTSTGAGGQSVNTTYSAVRITHIPTGLMVYCQEERSQKQNKERALSIIRARVFALEQERVRKEREEARRGQIGTGDRSEKIRTYNFPQDRVTDHRIKQNFHNITSIMDGNLDEIIDALKQAEVADELES